MNRSDYKEIDIRREFGTQVYSRPIFDHVQSHAVYNLREDTLPKVKQYLKSNGATRFRTLKLKDGLRILCYRGPKIG